MREHIDGLSSGLRVREHFDVLSGGLRVREADTARDSSEIVCSKVSRIRRLPSPPMTGIPRQQRAPAGR